jgi:uncharacterized protein (TIGR03435 family)
MRSALMAGIALWAAGAAYSQPAPAFDAASVKLLAPDDLTHRSAHASVTTNENGAKISLECVTLKELIQKACGVAEFQIAGPDWLSREQYDVVATVASPATKDHLWVMLQALLAERFKLSLHRETKLGPVYNLVVAKHGVKLQAVEPGPGGIKTSSGKLTVKLIATRQSMASLVDVLSRPTGRPVLDKTGLGGVYDFELEYAANDESPAPSVFTAVEEQLGLKLEPSKGSVEMLAIDHAERVPVAN